jgi:hypothetical protein
MPVCGLHGQQMSGIITNMEDGTPLPGAVVRNLSRHINTLSDAEGRYQIDAGNGDTLSFSYLGYHAQQILMPGSAEVYRNMGLRKKLFSLDEIQIGPGWTPYQRDSLERRGIYGPALERKKEGSVMIPVTFLAENISRKSRQRWRFQKNFPKWEGMKFIDTRYTPELVSELTQLRGDSLAAFINQFPMQEDFARSASELELKMWIRYNYRTWIRHPHIPQLPDYFIDSARAKE